MSQEEYKHDAAYLQSENPMSGLRQEEHQDVAGFNPSKSGSVDNEKIIDGASLSNENSAFNNIETYNSWPGSDFSSSDSFEVIQLSEEPTRLKFKREDDDHYFQDGSSTSHESQSPNLEPGRILQPYQLENYIKSTGTNWNHLDHFKKCEVLDRFFNLISLYKDKLVHIEKSLEEINIAEKLIEILKDTTTNDVQPKEGVHEMLHANALKLCVIFSDISEIFCQALTKNGAIGLFRDLLQKTNRTILGNRKMDVENERNYTITLFNIVNKKNADVKAFEESKCMTVLEKYINSQDEITQFASLITIVFVSGIKFPEALKVKSDVIRNLTLWLREAVDDKKERRSKNGFQAVNLYQALSKLTSYEEIKIKIKKKMNNLSRIIEVIAQNSDPVKGLGSNDFLAALHDGTKTVETNPEREQIKDHSLINLLLIGKTGNGKSATGNSILGHPRFPFNSNFSSVTKKVDYACTKYENRVIKVVDGPGVGDTCSITNAERAAKIVMNGMKEAIAFSVEGFHAFLLVIRFGGRFTAEDTEVIRILKVIFGSDFIKNYCILIVTCGDNFRNDTQVKTFEQWCEEQSGIFKELFLECNKRAILFDNQINDLNIKTRQRDDLIKAVDNLGRRIYTDANFQKVEADRELLLIQIKEPIIRQDTLITIDLILQELNELTNENGEDKQETLNKLLKEAIEIHNSIVETDNRTGVFKQLLSQLESLQKTIKEKINIQQKSKEMVNTQQRYTEEFKILEELREQQKQQTEELKKQHIEDEERRKKWEEQRMQEMALTESKLRGEFESERQKINEMLETERRKNLDFENNKLNIELKARLSEIITKEEQLLKDMKEERNQLKEQMNQERRRYESDMEVLQKRNEDEIAQLQTIQQSAKNTLEAQMLEMTKSREESEAISAKYKEDIETLGNIFEEVKEKFDKFIKMSFLQRLRWAFNPRGKLN